MQTRTKKIQIELTSQQDTKWTWRKVGAKQPKGEMSQELLSGGAKLGDQIWVEVVFDIDGVVVESVLPEEAKPGKPNKETETLELLGSGRAFKPVMVNYENMESSNKKGGKKEGRKKKKRPDRKLLKEKKEMPDSKVEKKSTGPKLIPTKTNQDAWLKSLVEEQKPIGEQLLRGGMEAVRKAVKADPEIESGDELLALAEKLLVDYRAAEWRDRAEAALAQVDKVRLTDLRSVLAAAEGLMRHKDIRSSAEELRKKLMERVEREHNTWLADIKLLIEEGRIVRALNLSSRPPKAGMPLPEDLAEALIRGANEALTPETPNKRWMSFIEAICRSPVAQRVDPLGVPNQPSSELLELAKNKSQYIPIILERLLAKAEQKAETLMSL